MLTINVNSHVRVRLTDHGRKILRDNHNRLFANLLEKYPKSPLGRYKPPEETDGWSEWQLWTLMQEFGPFLYNGCTVPFETEMQIVEEENAKTGTD